MDESVTRAECFALGMNAALGRYNNFIDIRDPEAFATWHGKAGLRCLACRHPVTVYEISSTHNRFVRHGRGRAASLDAKAGKSARETFLHYRLKHWVADELKALGSTDADVEVSVGDRRPDVFGHVDRRGYAVEIQWSPLDYTDAVARTSELRSAGADHVLWLTRSCNWIEQLPALGIKSFDPAGSDYRAHTGFLTYRPRAGLRDTEISVRNMLRQWVADEIAWAYRDHKKAGWATVIDWTQHTKAQANTIAEQRRQLDVARAYTERQALDLTAAKAAAVALESERDEVIDNSSVLLNTITSLRESADTTKAKHEQALKTAADRVEELEAAIDELETAIDHKRSMNDAAAREIKTLGAQLERAALRTALLWVGVAVLSVLCLALVAAWLIA